MAVVSGTVAYLVLVERRVAAFIQDRIGPNRVGPLGLLQPLADGLKFIFKEQIIPFHVDKPLYLMAPAVVLISAMIAFAVIPFGPDDNRVIAPGLDIGVLYLFSVGSLAVYGVILGGWSSNNKYSFFGAMRSSAQLISYEIPLGLSVVGVILLSGSLRLDVVVADQTDPFRWNVVVQPLGFLVFLISAFAESSRLPFDLPECEQELIGGYHTEYSGMKFAMFAMGEYLHLITASFTGVLLFFGGWHLPFMATEQTGFLSGLLMTLILVAKVLLCIFVAMWIRWSWPRFRFDQLMNIAWKTMIPIAMANLVITTLVVELAMPVWSMIPLSIVVLSIFIWIIQRPASHTGNLSATALNMSGSTTTEN